MEYLDFDIEISQEKDGAHVVAIDSPAGEARGKLQLALDPLALQARLHALEVALLRAGGPRRRTASAQERVVQGFGGELFGAIFRDDILSRYDVSRQEARSCGSCGRSDR
jgi:hypothetical protein